MLKSKYVFLTGIISMLAAGLALYTNHLGFALNIMQVSFGIFTLSLVFYFWELRDEK